METNTRRNEHKQQKIFFQFERIGYFSLDYIDSKKDQLVFNRTVNLRDSWACKK